MPGLEEDAVVLAPGERLPQLLRGEGEDRRHQPYQAVRDVMERALRRAPRHGVRLTGVEAVLEDVEVERAEVFRGERLQPLRDQVELVARVIRGNRLLHLGGHGEGIAVELPHVCWR